MTAASGDRRVADGADVVLIVEDDADLRESLVLLLKLRGYTCLEAENGAEAMEVLRAHGPPCLIVLDLMMPVMDGWSLRQALLAEPDLARIPVVVVSGAYDVAEEARRLQAVHYLVKPVESREMLQVVAEYC